MKNLTELAAKYGADKNHIHHYTELYEELFSKFVSPNILELGTHEGASVNMFLEYYDSPNIVSMNIEQAPGNRAPEDKYKFVLGDQSNIDDLKKCVEGQPPFEIIIDDASHRVSHHQISLGFLYEYVASGGYYIIEDLYTVFLNQYRDDPTKYDTYEMINLMKNKVVPFSHYIDIEVQQKILNKIDEIFIWSKIDPELKNPKQLDRSLVAVIKFK